jgi:hypothetical protein
VEERWCWSRGGRIVWRKRRGRSWAAFHGVRDRPRSDPFHASGKHMLPRESAIDRRRRRPATPASQLAISRASATRTMECGTTLCNDDRCSESHLEKLEETTQFPLHMLN